MRRENTRRGGWSLVLGGVLAAALLAVPATTTADDYDSAAKANGTTDYVAEIWSNSPSHTPPPVVEREEFAVAEPSETEAEGVRHVPERDSVEHFAMEVWVGEAGAASGEPEEETVGLTGSDEHKAWVKSIWESP